MTVNGEGKIWKGAGVAFFVYIPMGRLKTVTRTLRCELSAWSVSSPVHTKVVYLQHICRTSVHLHYTCSTSAVHLQHICSSSVAYLQYISWKSVAHLYCICGTVRTCYCLTYQPAHLTTFSVLIPRSCRSSGKIACRFDHRSQRF